MKFEKKLKICHVITRMIVGGAQENTLFTCLDHIEKGHDVTLLTGFSPGREGELLKKNQMSNKLKMIIVPSLIRNLSLINDLKTYFFMKKFFKKEKFDVVHTHSSKAGILGRCAAWNSHATKVVVHTVHGHAFHPYEKKWKIFIYKLAERLATKKSDKVFSVAQAMIDQCVEAKIAPKEKFKVVYSGMDIEQFVNAKRDLEMRKELNIPEDALVIGTLARLFAMKGYEYFFPVAEELLKDYPNLHILIIGDGEMYDELVARVKSKNIADKFHFVGLIAPHEVYKYLAQMDILHHLSLHEGLPRCAVQALAEKIPVIAFDLDGTPEVVINGKSGFCLPAKDVDGVVEKSRLLLDDNLMRQKMGEYGQSLVKEKFAHEYMSDILEEEYYKLINRNGE